MSHPYDPNISFLKALESAISDMIVRIGKDRVFRSFEGNVKGLGWPVDKYLNRTVDAVMPNAVADSVIHALDKVLETGQLQYLKHSLTIDDKIRYYKSRMAKSAEDEVIVVVRDVTFIRETEQELHRCSVRFSRQMEEHNTSLSVAESMYHDIFHNSGAPSIIIDQDRTIAMANEKFAEFIGHPRNKIENRINWTDFVHPMDRGMATRYHFSRRADEGSVPKEYECRFVDRENNVKSVILKVGLLTEPGRTVISIIDITSLKRTEEELRDRESLYSAILEGYEGLIYFIDENYRIRFLNENLIRELSQDATGQLCYEAIHHRQSPCHWCVAQQVFAGSQVRFEMQNPQDHKWYYSVNVPVTLSDNARYCQCMILDIDEQKLMEQTLRSSEAHLLEENTRLRSSMEERQGFGDIVGKSPAMQEVYELLLLAASSDNNVIIYGESGTGKELAAKTIHDMSSRRNGAFVPINCGAIPENLLESEFFGYKRGAFTGANSDKSGLLDEADRGSVFLDEIGEIDLGFQVKLLRAIEGGGFTPVGCSELHRPDFRIIAATNRNLTEKVKSGQMRSDFFYRVHVIPIYLPALRKRKEDIPLLTEAFLKAYDRKMRPQVTSKIMDTLMDYNWPGNVRELQNVLYRFVTLKRLDLTGDALTTETGFEQTTAPVVRVDTPLSETVADFEKQIITAALARCRWNRTQTARQLSIGLRTLQRKMKLYGIQ